MNRHKMGVLHKWQGYEYYLGEDNKFWVRRDGINPMPDNACFTTGADAKAGIAALIVASAIPTILGGPSRVDVFWSLLTLSGRRFDTRGRSK